MVHIPFSCAPLSQRRDRSTARLRHLAPALIGRIQHTSVACAAQHRTLQKCSALGRTLGRLMSGANEGSSGMPRLRATGTAWMSMTSMAHGGRSSASHSHTVGGQNPSAPNSPARAPIRAAGTCGSGCRSGTVRPARRRETEVGVSGGPPEPPGRLITHLHTVYMEYSERLSTLLNPSG